ncbi:urease accessory protein UreF [Rhizobium sp. SSA_523]|uniref:urease accessory protein UreF n=1 Tax=Rhizobium sp. SSA_523 TaxID=2952477 RepID=UPI0020906B85|nr:urease accessory protein UreF [Rhizobium sp. SSA_523]MCO5732104.1 urease accessory protein UreF [Rhizobium sp. SSA_523]WKC25648.1 urease accessory protein UreF [Rhizobium sp. SSA_523]
MTPNETQSLLRLMAWLSPAFPVGGFAYSGGLEGAVHDRLVADAAGLKAWFTILLGHGALWTDAVLLSCSVKAEGDPHRLEELSELGLALAGSAERHLETLSLGRAFLTAAQAWPDPVFKALPADCPYPVAVGAVAGAQGIGLQQALAAYLHAGVSQGVSAGIRLGLCGQQAGVALLAALEPLIATTAERAGTAGLDDLGTATVQADIAALRHEMQVSRLFRS